MDIAGLLDDMKERVRTRGATPLVGGGLLGSFTRGLLGLDPSEEDSKFSQDMMLKAYQTGQALSNTPTPLALAVAPAAIVKGAKSAKKALPQEKALETARKNAVEMLGLPESNTAMDRARAMGFMSDVYHGSDAKDISKFEPKRSKRGYGISVAVSPENAESYGKIIYPLKVNQEKIFDPTNKNQFYEVKTYIDRILEKQNPYDKNSLSFYPFTSKKVFENLTNPQTSAYFLENELITKALKDLGYSGSIGMESGQKQLKVFDPSNIRSRFAAFDPKRINDPDLLASLAAFGVGIPAYGLLEEE